jgi:hypothetical protein
MSGNAAQCLPISINRFGKLLGPTAAQSLALQPLGERLADGVRQRLAGQRSNLAGQAIGLLVLGTQRQVEYFGRVLTSKNERPLAVSPTALLRFGSPGRTRTSDQAVNSRSLYQLSYRGSGRPL